MMHAVRGSQPVGVVVERAGAQDPLALVGNRVRAGESFLVGSA